MKDIVKVIITIFIVILIVFNQNLPAQNNSKNQSNMVEQWKSELIKTEEDFYNATQERGWGQAFIDFADDNSTLLRQDAYPVISKDALINLYKGKESNILNLKWSPLKADVSNDGSLGYTYGNWIYTFKNKEGKEENVYGNYVTIWKKHPDGKWKFVLDGGNTTPAPKD